MSPLFGSVVPCAPDPIFKVSADFQRDPRPEKINLGIGIYKDEAGRVPAFGAALRAEQVLLGKNPPGYLPILGHADFNRHVQHLIFGGTSALTEGRILTAQTPGGTGGLRVGADILRHTLGAQTIWMSDPTWDNHPNLFDRAGFRIERYPYFDPRTGLLDYAGMVAGLRRIPAGAPVLLHACCHNPTGVDPTEAEWRGILEVFLERGLIPFFDLAYQGFGEGLERDALPVRLFVDAGLPVIAASSFSKNCSLYERRTGAVSYVTSSAREVENLRSHVEGAVRSMYSNPPADGARIINEILSSPELRSSWEEELSVMRLRIKALRQELVAATRARGADFSFLASQHGMFSYTRLSKAQVHRLRDEFAIYVIETGRTCVAALNRQTIPRVAEGLAAVVKTGAGS